MPRPFSFRPFPFKLIFGLYYSKSYILNSFCRTYICLVPHSNVSSDFNMNHIHLFSWQGHALHVQKWFRLDVIAVPSLLQVDVVLPRNGHVVNCVESHSHADNTHVKFHAMLVNITPFSHQSLIVKTVFSGVTVNLLSWWKYVTHYTLITERP